MKKSIIPFSERPLPEWTELFRSSLNAEERYRALQAITTLADPAEAIRFVKDGLNDSDSAVRAGVARWLASRAESQTWPGSEAEWTSIAARWMQLLGDDDPDVCFESARGLVQLNPADIAAANVLARLLDDLDTQPAMLPAILKAYRAIDRAASLPDPPWNRLLHHEQAAVREETIRTLASRSAGSASVAEQLLPLLDDEEPFVREEAAKALGTIRVASPSIIAALQSATSDDDEVVATAARSSLQQLKERSA